MSGRHFLSSLLMIFLLSTNVFSEEKTTELKGPIIITSEMLTADNKTHTALFEKSVVARSPEMILHAERMLVYYDGDTGNVTKIEASGSVRLIKGDRIITSNEAVYFAKEDKAIFVGEPRAIERENVVTGRKMTYFLKEDRFLVEGSKVFISKKSQ
ncbi:MAG: LptA/OstA family protein [Nitrospirota bacterium]